MGTDKAFVEVGGRPMVLRVADALRAGGCGSIECQGGDIARLAALGLDAFVDAAPGDGPVPAIRQAMSRHAGIIVVAACDLPDLDGPSVAAVAAAVDSGAAAAVASAAGRHLLIALGPGAARLCAAAAPAPTSVRDLLDAVAAVDVPVAERFVRNVNRPDDLG